MNLFGVYSLPPEDCETGESVGAGHGRRGSAGHDLVLADLKIRGYDAADLSSNDTDIVSEIDGKFRRFQVKASISNHFGTTPTSKNGSRVGNRGLTSYKGKIDAFVFVNLIHRAVYYVAAEAICDDSITIANFGRQTCDLSFQELLRRWGV